MEQFGHERLRVYQCGLQYVSWVQSLLGGIDKRAAVIDHLDRAADSVIENVANANSRRGMQERNQYFDFALGSGLESAACLDVCECKHLITPAAQCDGKMQLHRIVSMLVRLKASQPFRVREEAADYQVREPPQTGILFGHEALDVYRLSLDLVRWVDARLPEFADAEKYVRRLDSTSTAIVLNIAEGNGRFCAQDHRLFIDIAYTSAMKVAATLDTLIARTLLSPQEAADAKHLLVRIAPMLMSLRAYLTGEDQQNRRPRPSPDSPY